jgi:hypothetical protein
MLLATEADYHVRLDNVAATVVHVAFLRNTIGLHNAEDVKHVTGGISDSGNELDGNGGRLCLFCHILGRMLCCPDLTDTWTFIPIRELAGPATDIIFLREGERSEWLSLSHTKVRKSILFAYVGK